MSRIWHWLRNVMLPPIAALAVVLSFWQFATWWFEIKKYLLPGPLLVWKAARENSAQLSTAIWLTGSEAITGFLLSLLVGTLVACLFSQSLFVRRSLFPYALFLQTVPIVAIAPLIVIWFGTGFQSVVLVSFIISLFPIITNGTAGLLSVDPDLLDLFRLNNATRWQTLWKLRLPSAVPSLITGAKISSGVAVIGAIVGEFFTGYGSEKYGLGYLILLTKDQLKTDKLFATVIASTLLGLLIFSVVSGVGGMILRKWYAGTGHDRT